MTEASKIKERINPILADRKAQIALNLKAKDGGFPYIKARLSRWPAESDASWEGDSDKDILPRVRRTDNIDYAKRIVEKMSQLVFSSEVERDGADEDFTKDVTTCGDSLMWMMSEACKYFLAAGWCWISVDRTGGATDDDGNPLSVAQRMSNGDRVYWRLWSPLEVWDWKFDNDGLVYIITHETGYIDEDPKIDRVRTETVTLYDREMITEYVWRDKADSGEENPTVTEMPNPIPGQVNFVNIGTPSDGVCGFDSVELSQMVILNLNSSFNEILYKAAFPLMVLDIGIVSAMAQIRGIEDNEAMTMLKGIDVPILETSEFGGKSRYMEMDASAAKIIPDAIDKAWSRLTETKGVQILNPTLTKMVQSSESKQIDMLDISTILSAVAQVIQEGESKAVELSQLFDSSFLAWMPVYPEEFKTSMPEEMAGALDKIPERPELPEMTRIKAKSELKVLEQISPISDDERKKVIDEIEKANFIDFSMTAPVENDEPED